MGSGPWLNSRGSICASGRYMVRGADATQISKARSRKVIAESCIETSLEAGMGFFDKLRNELIDIIEWTDNTQDTIVWRFPRYENEIKNGAKLVVRESQVAAFVSEGKLADVFQP